MPVVRFGGASALAWYVGLDVVFRGGRIDGVPGVAWFVGLDVVFGGRRIDGDSC